MYERFSEDFSPPECLFQTPTMNLSATWSVNAVRPKIFSRNPMRCFSYLFLLFLYTTETPFYTPQSLHYPISFEIRRWTDFLRLNLVRCQLSPEVEDVSMQSNPGSRKDSWYAYFNTRMTLALVSFFLISFLDPPATNI